MPFDLLLLYAFADKSHARDRELWREFVSFLLETLLEIDASEAEKLVDGAVAKSPEELTENLPAGLPTLPQLVRHISGALCQSLHLPVEMGLASFVEFNPPTRVHSVGRSKRPASDEAVLSTWLSSFQKARKEQEFLEMTSSWKRLFEQCVTHEELAESA